MDKAKFFASVRSSLFGGSLTTSQVQGIEAILNEWINGGYDDERRLAYILATAHHETGAKFVASVENLNYSAKRLTQVWPSRFPSIAAATPYANNPQKLANKVYGGRLGNVNPNDGWDFRGRGFVQITGRDNYAKYGLMTNPASAADTMIAARIAVDGMVNGRFTGLKLSQFFDHDSDDAVGARRIINPDSNGDEIAEFHVKYLAALKAAVA